MNIPKLLIALPLIGTCLSCLNNSNNNYQTPTMCQDILFLFHFNILFYCFLIYSFHNDAQRFENLKN